MEASLSILGSPVGIHQIQRQRFTIVCNNPSKASPCSPAVLPQNQQTPSLSDQLKPLSTTILSDPRNERTYQASYNAKSTWVNPAKPRRTVISHIRHKRTPPSSGPLIPHDALKVFVKRLNECEASETALTAVLGDNPLPISKETALFVLKSLKPWQKTRVFFNWIKAQNLLPMEPIFYNVTMKSLRHGNQFGLVEELAHEMIANGIELDNITYCTIITCAKRCGLFEKAVEWFEKMYQTELMPDEVTYSAVLDLYAKLGKVQEVMTLYERGRTTGWKPDPITFSVLAKMFGEARDCDGINFVLQEMRNVELQPNLIVYNTLLEAMGKVGKPGLAKSFFKEMIDTGITLDERTLTSLLKIYGKARWAKDALDLWEQIKSNGWPVDLILCNTLLNMCADIGMEEEAEKLFDDMKGSVKCRPNNWSYTAMLKMFGNKGKVDTAMGLFEEMLGTGVELDIMGCTCLIQCLGRFKRVDDLVRVFGICIERGIKPDDKLCGCLLSVVSFFDKLEDVDKVITCLNKANLKLVAFITLLENGSTNFETIKEEFRGILEETAVVARRPFCNCLIDFCRNRGFHERAHELLYLGSLYGLYPDLHNRSADEWCLNVRSLSVGAAHTAFEEWMGTVARFVESGEELPVSFSAQTGGGSHNLSQGLASSFASHVKKLAAPFRRSEDDAGCFEARREDIVSWVKLSHAASAIPA